MRGIFIVVGTISVLMAVTSLTNASALTCAACEGVFSALDHFIASNSTEALIENTLYKLCNTSILPHSVQAVCDVVVSDYTPEIVKMLVDKMEPSAICTKLSLC